MYLMVIVYLLLGIRVVKNDKTIYKIKSSGEELVVNDGNTYIQIYPTSGNLSIN